jgi:hypothetical protein
MNEQERKERENDSTCLVSMGNHNINIFLPNAKDQSDLQIIVAQNPFMN